MSLSPTEIKTIVDSLRASNWDQAVVTVGDTRVALARNGKSLPFSLEGNVDESASPAVTNFAPQTAATLPAIESNPLTTAQPTMVQEATPAPVMSESDHVVTSPTVGVFWRSPEPGAASFVEVGQLVKVGDTLGIVEIMKLMSNISADVSGVITAFHAENADAVEFGTPLISIKPES